MTDFRPKMTHHPYLQITLSTTPIGLEEGESGRSVTCQYVLAKRKRRDGDAAAAMKSKAVRAEGTRDKKEQRDVSFDGSNTSKAEKTSAKTGGYDTVGTDGKNVSPQKALKRKSETDGERRGKKPKKGIAGVEKT